MKDSLHYRGEEYKYALDLSNEDLIEHYTSKLVFDWCKKNHPDIEIKAKEIVTALILNKEAGSLVNEKV